MTGMLRLGPMLLPATTACAVGARDAPVGARGEKVAYAPHRGRGYQNRVFSRDTHRQAASAADARLVGAVPVPEGADTWIDERAHTAPIGYTPQEAAPC